MAITVIKFIGREFESQGQSQAASPQNRTQSNNSLGISSQAQFAARSEAAYSSVRKASQEGEAHNDLSTFREAKSSADEVAEKIKENPESEAPGAHARLEGGALLS